MPPYSMRRQFACTSCEVRWCGPVECWICGEPGVVSWEYIPLQYVQAAT